MIDASKYYKHSGVFSIPGFLMMLVMVVPLSAVVGVAYGLAVFYVPFVKISFIITAAAGGGLGYLLGKLGLIGKVRSMAALLTVSLLGGIVAWYCSWVTWILIASEFELLILTPYGLYAFMELGFYEGFWSMGSGDEAFKGYPLVAVWCIEAAMLIGIAAIVPYSMLCDRLFCETCTTWIKGLSKFPQREPVADPAGLVNALEGADFEALAALGPRTSNDEPYTSVEISCCERCGELGYLDVKSCVLVESKDGVSTQETSLVKHLIVPPALIGALTSRWADAAEAEVADGGEAVAADYDDSGSVEEVDGGDVVEGQPGMG